MRKCKVTDPYILLKWRDEIFDVNVPISYSHGSPF